MKKTAFFLTAIVALFMISCGESAGPVAIPTDVSNIRAESRPGAIFLQWDVPQERGYEHLWITWTDPRTQENMRYVVSSFYRNNSSFLVENTLQRHGEYVFTFRTVNTSTGTWSPNRQEIRAVSGRAPYVLNIGPPMPLLLTVDMLSASSNHSDFPLSNLLTDADGDRDIFATLWSVRTQPQWIQIDLGEEINSGYISFSVRNRDRGNHNIVAADFQVSMDGNTWTTLESFSDFELGYLVVNEFGPIVVTEPFRYIRLANLLGSAAFPDAETDGLVELSRLWIYTGTFFFHDPEVVD